MCKKVCFLMSFVLLLSLVVPNTASAVDPDLLACGLSRDKCLSVACPGDVRFDIHDDRIYRHPVCRRGVLNSGRQDVFGLCTSAKYSLLRWAALRQGVAASICYVCWLGRVFRSVLAFPGKPAVHKDLHREGNADGAHYFGQSLGIGGDFPAHGGLAGRYILSSYHFPGCSGVYHCACSIVLLFLEPACCEGWWQRRSEGRYGE